MGARDFRQLKVWEKSHKLALDIYRITENFPREEIYGLTSQMRRSSSSIPTNIAEGCGRSGQAEFTHFLQIALGSASELDYQILLARDLTFLQEEAHNLLAGQVAEIKSMLFSLIRRIRSGSSSLVP